MLEITYKDNHGHLKINLEQLLPCSASDFRKLLSFVDLSDDIDGHAAKIFAYIAEQVETLKNDRKAFSPDNDNDRKMIARINATLKRYLSLAATLAKKYGLPELADDDAQTVIKAATVYANIKNTAVAFDGCTFSKAGYIFDIRKEKCGRRVRFIVMLNGTGLQVAEGATKTEAVAAVTPRIIEMLNSRPEVIKTSTEDFRVLLMDAGFITDERPETISDECKEQEETSMPAYAFTPDTITIDGRTFPAEYKINDENAVIAFAITGRKPNGLRAKTRIIFDAGHADHAAALAAARAALPADSCEQTRGNAPAPAAAKPEPEKCERSEVPKRNPKAARGPVPEKKFIGQTIHGNGWRIFFDGEKERTRIIFDGTPTDKAKKVIEKAGFYYSAAMKSWNKKLTFKAYRAAHELSGKLTKLYAA